MKTTYGYIRDSLADGGGATAAQQRTALEDYYARNLKPRGFHWGGWCEGGAETADTMAGDLPEGCRLTLPRLKAGDAILLWSLKEVFAGLDPVNFIRQWLDRSVRVVSVRDGLDSDLIRSVLVESWAMLLVTLAGLDGGSA